MLDCSSGLLQPMYFHWDHSFLFLHLAFCFSLYQCLLTSAPENGRRRLVSFLGYFCECRLATLRRHEEDICAEASKFEVRCDEWDGPEGQHEVNSQGHSNSKTTESEPISTGHSDFRSSAQAIAMRIDVAEFALRLVTLGDEQQAVWRADAIYTDRDALAETCASRGPFGCIGSAAWMFRGLELKILCNCLKILIRRGKSRPRKILWKWRLCRRSFNLSSLISFRNATCR